MAEKDQQHPVMEVELADRAPEEPKPPVGDYLEDVAASALVDDLVRQLRGKPPENPEPTFVVEGDDTDKEG